MTSAVVIRITVILLVVGGLIYFMFGTADEAQSGSPNEINFNNPVSQWTEADLIAKLELFDWACSDNKLTSDIGQRASRRFPF